MIWILLAIGSVVALLGMALAVAASRDVLLPLECPYQPSVMVPNRCGKCGQPKHEHRVTLRQERHR